MKRIRDYFVSRALEEVTKKKIEYILDEDLNNIEELVIANPEPKVVRFKDIADFEFLSKLPSNLRIEFIGFDLTNYEFNFGSALEQLIIRKCKIDGLKVNCDEAHTGFELVLDKNRNEGSIQVNEQFKKCKCLQVIGKPTIELTREYTVEEITENMKKEEPNYIELGDELKAALLKKHGYLSVYPQRIEITGIDKLKLLKRIKLAHMEIDTINFSEITKYTKDIRVLDEIRFEECKFNEAPVLYKQPVKRLVIDKCRVDRKELLPNFVQVNAIEVIGTKGMELPKLNEPKLLKGIKLVSSEVKLEKIVNLKKIETVIILDQKLPDIKFAKKLKNLKHLVVTKGFVEDASVAQKLKKLQYIEVEQDDLAAPYNELFV